MKNPHKRQVEKRISLLNWIGTFRLTTFSLWCENEGLVARGQHHFKKKLLEEKLIGIYPYQGAKEDILMLTSKGKQLIRGFNPELRRAVTDPSRISASQIPHTLLVQKSINAFHDKSREFVVEPQFEEHQSSLRPDALIWVDNQLTALEMENTPKHNLRVYCILRQHIAMILDGLYTQVLYCFSNNSTYDFYRHLLEEQLWPVVVFNRQQQRYLQKRSDEDELLGFDPEHYREKFSLRMIDGSLA